MSRPQAGKVNRATFHAAVVAIVERGDYPSARLLNRELARGGKWLFRRELHWRREACAALGFTLRGGNLDPGDPHGA